MQIHTSNSVSVIAIQIRTTLETINRDVGELPESLAADIIQLGIKPTGPMMFLYNDVTADPKKPFDMRIASPVSQEDAARYSGEHTVTRLEPFSFVEIVLHGDLAGLAERAYQPLLKQIGERGLSMTGFSREVYQNFENPSSADNETRVQIGVSV